MDRDKEYYIGHETSYEGVASAGIGDSAGSGEGVASAGIGEGAVRTGNGEGVVRIDMFKIMKGIDKISA